MSGYPISSPVLILPSTIIHTDSKVITSGAGNVELIRFTPPSEGMYYFDITAHAYTDVGATPEDKISEFHERHYVYRDSGGTVSIVEGFGASIFEDYTSEISGSDFVLSISRDNANNRAVTVHAVVMFPPGVNLVDVVLSPAT